MASSNYYIRTAAQKVFRPNEPSDLEKALRYKRMYGTEEDRKAVEEALAEAKKSPLNIAIDNNPDEIEDILNRQKEYNNQQCYDPIKENYCILTTLQYRKRTHKDLYKDVIPTNCIIR